MIDTILISILVSSLLVILFYFYFKGQSTTSSTSLVIHPTIQEGKKLFKSSTKLPLSSGQQQGMTFSYTCWLKINDFAYRYGEQKIIFNKGSDDLKSACPALLLDSTTNSLLVRLDTFGGTEVIPISNIPAKKWLHVAIAVDQDSVDIYINGVLYTHHSLVHLPKQNSFTVSTGTAGGFDGKLSNLVYYAYFLDESQIKNAMSSPPKPDPSDNDAGPLPPYFDVSWWTGRKD